MVKKPKAYRTGMGKAQPGDANVAEDQVARERAQMLVERQAELDGVLDRHDDMVRVLRFVRSRTGLGNSNLRVCWPRSARCFISNSL